MLRMLCTVLNIAVNQYNQLTVNRLDWIEQCFTSPPIQYRLYDSFYMIKDPTNSIKVLKGQIVHREIEHTISRQNTASPLVYNNMGVTRGRLPQWRAFLLM